MVVASTPPTQNYEEFTQKVRDYSSKEPFNFPVPERFLLDKFEKVSEFLVKLTIPLFFPAIVCNDLAFFPVCFHLRGLPVRFGETLRQSSGPVAA